MKHKDVAARQDLQRGAETRADGEELDRRQSAPVEGAKDREAHLQDTGCRVGGRASKAVEHAWGDWPSVLDLS
jgi:hypothetical protein